MIRAPSPAELLCYNGEAAPGLTPNAAPDTLRD